MTKHTAKLGLLTSSLAVAGALSAAAPAPAAMFGVRAGEYTEAGEPFLGFEMITPLRQDIWFNPNFEYVFVDDGDLVTLNFDFHYDFEVERPLMFWVGGGPAVLFSDRDRQGGDQDNETDFGLNALAGVGWTVGSVVPYAQLKAVLSDDNELVLGFGVRF